MVLRLRTAAPAWEHGKCCGQATGPDNDPWFDNSDEDSGGHPNEQDWARDFCNGTGHDLDFPCPIRHDCLIFALVNNERAGVWGGTSEIDRRALRKMWPWPGGDEPHPEWEWHPPGEVAKMLPTRTRATLDQDDDDE